MSLKDRTFDLLQGTYGLDAETIADRLAVSSIEGTIDGVDAWIEIRDRPPADIPPDLLMTSDGGFRELTEEEQEEYAARSCDDKDEDDDEPPRLRGLWVPSDN